eukprot:7376874-Prymnesium_polylepis.2
MRRVGPRDAITSTLQPPLQLQAGIIGVDAVASRQLVERRIEVTEQQQSACVHLERLGTARTHCARCLAVPDRCSGPSHVDQCLRPSRASEGGRATVDHEAQRHRRGIPIAARHRFGCRGRVLLQLLLVVFHRVGQRLWRRRPWQVIRRVHHLALQTWLRAGSARIHLCCVHLVLDLLVDGRHVRSDRMTKAQQVLRRSICAWMDLVARAGCHICTEASAGRHGEEELLTEKRQKVAAAACAAALVVAAVAAAAVARPADSPPAPIRRRRRHPRHPSASAQARGRVCQGTRQR